MNPLISVIIPVYNGRAHLMEQMNAMLDQQCDFPWEVLYIDNGSTDDSRDLIGRRIATENLQHVRLVDGSQETGQVYARNYGTRLARADLLAYTDQDDLPSPTWLAGMAEALGHADAVGGYVLVTPDGQPPPADRNTRPPPPDFSLICGHFKCAIGNNFGIHRAVFDAVGGWHDIGVRAGEDVDISIRLHLGGYVLLYAPNARVTWRARTHWRDIFNQGVTYGRSFVLNHLRYKANGLRHDSPRKMLGRIKRTLIFLIQFLRTPRKYEGIKGLGILWGQLQENIRARSFYF